MSISIVFESKKKRLERERTVESERKSHRIDENVDRFVVLFTIDFDSNYLVTKKDRNYTQKKRL